MNPIIGLELSVSSIIASKVVGFEKFITSLPNSLVSFDNSALFNKS